MHLDNVKAAPNQLERYLTLSREIKAYDDRSGLSDTIRLVTNDKLQYTA